MDNATFIPKLKLLISDNAFAIHVQGCTITLPILMGFSRNVDRINMELPILYIKGSQVKIVDGGWTATEAWRGSLEDLD